MDNKGTISMRISMRNDKYEYANSLLHDTSSRT